MLEKGEPTPQLQPWLDRLAPVVAEARAVLATAKPGKLILRTGCSRDAAGSLRMRFFWREYAISWDDFVVRRVDTGEEPPSFTQSLILTYLATADGTTPSSRWIGFRELPDGMFYARAFQGYAGNRLACELARLPGDEVESFRRGAVRLGGELLQVGDAGYAFTVLPHLHLAVVHWQGDEEFPSQVRVLFEDTACHYMPTDGLAILGSQLVGYIAKAARLTQGG